MEGERVFEVFKRIRELRKGGLQNKKEWRKKIFEGALMVESLENKGMFSEVEKLQKEFPNEFSIVIEELRWLQSWAK
jgi:hypothetical protein